MGSECRPAKGEPYPCRIQVHVHPVSLAGGKRSASCELPRSVGRTCASRRLTSKQMPAHTFRPKDRNGGSQMGCNAAKPVAVCPPRSARAADLDWDRKRRAQEQRQEAEHRSKASAMELALIQARMQCTEGQAQVD